MHKSLSRQALLIAIISAGIAALTLSLIFAYSLYTSSTNKVAPEANIQTKNAGVIRMTGIPRDGSPQVSSIYDLDVATGELKVINNDRDYYAPSVSAIGTMAVVTTDGEDFGLFLSKDQNGENAVRIVPPAPALYPGLSDWSPDGRFLAYDALISMPSDDENGIEYSRVVVLDINTGEQQIIDEGVSPVFMNSGIAYIARDGVYWRSLSDGGIEDPLILVKFNSIFASRFAMLAVSRSESHFAVSLPDMGMITLYRPSIGGIETIDTINTSASWPVFSPDGMKLAYVVTDGPEVRFLEDYGIESRVRTIKKDLSNMQMDFLSVTDWR